MKIFFWLLVAVFAVGLLSVFAFRDDGRSISIPITAGDESALHNDVDSLWPTGPQFDRQQAADEVQATRPEIRTGPDTVDDESRFLDVDLTIWADEDIGEPVNIGDDLDVDGPGSIYDSFGEVVEIGEFIDVETGP